MPPFSTEHRRKISEAQRGDKGNNWKGGKMSLNYNIRKTFVYRQWRSDVFTRDNFTCQECFANKVYLNADHIKPFTVIVGDNKIKTVDEALNCAELWNINNGRTLCKPCHLKTKTWGRNYSAYEIINEKQD